MAKNRSAGGAPLVAVLALAACTRSLPPVLGGAHLEELAVSVDPPGHVAILLAAQAARQPLTDMYATSFRVYENGELLDPGATGQTLLPPAAVTSFDTLLMLDTSGALTPEERASLAHAAADFAGALQGYQDVTIFAFDGSTSPTLIGEFPQGSAPATPDALQALLRFEPKDASRDLRGALVHGLRELNLRMMEGSKPLRVGALVVLARGGDLAKRVGDNAYYGALDATRRDVFVVSIGEATPELRRLGKSGVVAAQSLQEAGPALEEAAARVRGIMAKHYLLSYCSLARGGIAKARVEARTVDANGRERIGRFSFEYDASRFGAGCDATRTPSFGKRPGLATEPAPTSDPGTRGTPARSGSEGFSRGG